MNWNHGEQSLSTSSSEIDESEFAFTDIEDYALEEASTSLVKTKFVTTKAACSTSPLKNITSEIILNKAAQNLQAFF